MLNHIRVGRLLVQILMDIVSLTRNYPALLAIIVLSLINQLVVCAAAWVLIRNLDATASFANVLNRYAG